MAAALYHLFGKTTVYLDRQDGRIFSGVLCVGRTLRFNPQETISVRIVTAFNRADEDSKTEIFLTQKDGKELRFGSLLSEKRRSFMAETLRRSLRGDRFKDRHR